MRNRIIVGICQVLWTPFESRKSYRHRSEDMDRTTDLIRQSSIERARTGSAVEVYRKGGRQ